MLSESLVLSIIIGKIRGFRIRNLEAIRIEKWWLVVFSVGLEVLASILLKRESLNHLREIINNYYLYIHILVYALLFMFLKYNISLRGFKSVFLGSILNFIVIIVNKGFMPVDTSVAEAMGYHESTKLLMSGKIAGHTLMLKNTPLWFLGDIINIPPPYPFPQTISIGDIFISLGVFIFIQYGMKETRPIKNAT